jgi:hypothetical protein
MTVAKGVVVAGLLAFLVVTSVILSHSSERLSGTNLVPNGAYIQGLGHGQEACQEGELLPADTAALRMTIGTYGKPGPPLTVAFTGTGGRLLTTGTLKPGWREGVVRIPVTHVSEASEEARFCLRDDGARPIALAGDSPDPGYKLQIAGRTIESQRVRIDYMRPGSESWLELAPTIVHRFGVAKAGWVRGWAWLAAIALMLGALALALREVLRAHA